MRRDLPLSEFFKNFIRQNFNVSFLSNL